jgi:hypothetical protein
MRPRTVQRLHCLLLAGLDGHASYIRLVRRKPDCPRISRIVLVATNEGFDLLGWQELHLMAQTAKYACPVVCAGTSLHCDARWLALRKELRQLRSRQLLATDLPSLGFYPVQLHRILGQV